MKPKIKDNDITKTCLYHFDMGYDIKLSIYTFGYYFDLRDFYVILTNAISCHFDIFFVSSKLKRH